MYGFDRRLTTVFVDDIFGDSWTFDNVEMVAEYIDSNGIERTMIVQLGLGFSNSRVFSSQCIKEWGYVFDEVEVKE